MRQYQSYVHLTELLDPATEDADRQTNSMESDQHTKQFGEIISCHLLLLMQK